MDIYKEFEKVRLNGMENAINSIKNAIAAERDNYRSNMLQTLEESNDLLNINELLREHFKSKENALESFQQQPSLDQQLAKQYISQLDQVFI